MTLKIRQCSAIDIHPATIHKITDLINSVYSIAEKGMWIAGFERIRAEEVEKFITDGKLILAFWEDELAGSVFVTRLSPTLGEFGMLVCHPDFRHKGIGTSLIEAAEGLARSWGCQKMQLEILYPRSWQQKSKEILKVWYPGMGYIKSREEDFSSLYPNLVPLLATECCFSTYLKDL